MVELGVGWKRKKPQKTQTRKKKKKQLFRAFRKLNLEPPKKLKLEDMFNQTFLKIGIAHFYKCIISTVAVKTSKNVELHNKYE